jgi:hypothetical protein
MLSFFRAILPPYYIINYRVNKKKEIVKRKKLNKQQISLTQRHKEHKETTKNILIRLNPTLPKNKEQQIAQIARIFFTIPLIFNHNVHKEERCCCLKPSLPKID